MHNINSSVRTLKQTFIDRYNSDATELTARKKAIGAAIQHNLLYSSSIETKYRESIRDYWSTCLEEIGWEFRKSVSIAEYENIVQKLKDHMNSKFGSAFDNKSKHGSEFRISHSQKSISVYVKHLWCLEKISEPTICPIDRIILSKTAARKNSDCSWGYVNSIEEHRRKFKYVLDEAARHQLTLANWELSVFEQ